MIDYPERKRVEVLNHDETVTGIYGKLIGFTSVIEYHNWQTRGIIELDDGLFGHYDIDRIRVVDSDRIRK